MADFLSMMQNVMKAIGMRISNPQKIVLRDDKSESYLREIRGNFDKGYELVVAVFPTNRADRYNSLKRLVGFSIISLPLSKCINFDMI